MLYCIPHSTGLTLVKCFIASKPKAKCMYSSIHKEHYKKKMTVYSHTHKTLLHFSPAHFQTGHKQGKVDFPTEQTQLSRSTTNSSVSISTNKGVSFYIYLEYYNT